MSRLCFSNTKISKYSLVSQHLVLCYITCPSRPPGTSSSAAKLAIASSAGWTSPRAVLKMSATKTKVALSVTTSWVCSCKYSSKAEEMASRSSRRRSSVSFLLIKERVHYCKRLALYARKATRNSEHSHYLRQLQITGRSK